MDINSLKLKLIEKIIKTDDLELLENMLEMLSHKATKFCESQAPYSIKEDEPVDLSTLSPELQESIKRGLADVEAGRVYTQEQMEKLFENWLQED